MIFDVKDIQVNVRDWRTTVLGSVFLTLGVCVAVTPFYFVAKDLELEPSLFESLKEYAKWVAGVFILLGLFLIGFIRTGKKEKGEDEI